MLNHCALSFPPFQFIKKRAFEVYLFASLLICMRDVYVLTMTLPCSYKLMAKVKAGLSSCVAWSAVCSLVARLGYGEEGAQGNMVPAVVMGGGLVLVFVECGVGCGLGKKRRWREKGRKERRDSRVWCNWKKY